MVLEVIGAMLITFLYLTQTEEKTKMSSDPAITTLIISATYTAVTSSARASGVVTSSPFNPASSLGIFFSILFNGEIGEAKGIWVFFFFAYGGSLLAVFLFEFVYKKAMQVVESGNAAVADEEDDRSEHDALMPDHDMTAQ